LFNVSPIRSNSLFLSSPFIIKVALKREREKEKRERERRGEGRSPSRSLVLGIIIIRIICVCIEENTCAACVRLKIGTKQV
jgi:hypothetical protein